MLIDVLPRISTRITVWVIQHTSSRFRVKRSLACSSISSRFSTRHSLIERCYCRYPSLIQCVSMMTRYLLPSNCVTSSQHASKVALVLPCRLPHVREFPVSRVEKYWWRCYSKLMKRYTSHQCGGLQEVPSLQFGRSILRRRTWEMKYDLHRRHCRNLRRVTSC
jgi:hypothetical protein